ncbi:hypothetical protein PRIPAC_86915 [Pristionchus pacificus]|uniref:Lipase n=1 Tax=Pristionchus pacificus TaxID=54126 RepID=A0A2A6BVB1_PRIPA|nr:hypothetical protein PRIPAC_86915 [Pristionchus pacificus]|eukprot:PDM69808.1 lipase [Pristionchus pacificus]
MPIRVFLALLLPLITNSSLISAPQPGFKYDEKLTRLSLEYAAASYADDPWPCLRKNNASLVLQVNVPCDAVRDKCWAIVVDAPEHIVVAFQGTSSRTQLITELVESITSPKHQVPGIGSVQRYFYVALESIVKPLALKLNKLRELYPSKSVLFTGHSLGGALASLAAVQYANSSAIETSKLYLITFGQPRVGNYEYAQSVDRLVPNTWRIVHKFDLVAHVPYCVGLRTCQDFLNHSPYHHGTEVWYPTAMNSTDLYRVCDGKPLDEDAMCSNAHYFYSIDDHLHYFERHVSDYGIAGCPVDSKPGATVSRRAHRFRKINRKLPDIPEIEAIMMITEAAMARWAEDYIEYVWDWWHRKNTTGSVIDGDAEPFRPSW